MGQRIPYLLQLRTSRPNVEWIANVKIAKALGITIPPTIMVQAKRVIR
jgi:hypothetical protein